ncbi:GMP synthase [Comamonas thiooxydans]|uniref:glutamine amidotransferase n=1 Tax=Comamonas thiooxydans TaxID=363952 RepID=UPI00155180BD|nr:glutamine amidotransferase [Comamonas thiooxydans]BDB69547.1 GMP synthase [Comamonas thiooxydans]
MDSQSWLLIQAGKPPEDIRVIAGDLPQWFLATVGCRPETMDIVKVYEGEPLPEPGQHLAAIITGSWSVVTDQHPWSEAIGQVVTQGMPLMGVCYGHQLMAHALEGVVDYHHDGREMGSLEIEQLAIAEPDAWLAGCPPRFQAHLTHLQTILRLLNGARALARSAHDPHQIVRYSPSAVSVQFHPEFTSEVMAACINARAQVLRAEGLDPAAILQGVSPTPTPLMLLRRFIETHAGTVSAGNSAASLNVAMGNHPELPQGTAK